MLSPFYNIRLTDTERKTLTELAWKNKSKNLGRYLIESGLSRRVEVETNFKTENDI